MLTMYYYLPLPQLHRGGVCGGASSSSSSSCASSPHLRKCRREQAGGVGVETRC